MIVDYIDRYRERFGVGPICRVLTEHGLRIAPSTYYATKQRGMVSEAVLAEAYAANAVFDLWVANRRVYGVRKLWHAARRVVEVAWIGWGRRGYQHADRRPQWHGLDGWCLAGLLSVAAGALAWFKLKPGQAADFAATHERRSLQASMLLDVGVSCQALDLLAQAPGGFLSWIGTAIALAGTALVVWSGRQRSRSSRSQ